ncbi:MAG: HlyD family efflux transporter periplasmic adaptor subunit [Oscillospiraceae bacterium]|nr:HlyD family efflux transporter periplasmic adaptor subunit [Oscillospiraceae bacterium]
MKSRTFGRIAVIVLLLAVCIFFGVTAYRSLQNNSMLTATAVAYEAGETYVSSGYFVRNESVLASRFPITIPTRSEGDKVGVGQVIASGYTDAEAQQHHEQVLSLEAKLAQLIALNTDASTASDAVSADAQLCDQFSQLSIHVSRRDMNAAASLTDSLKALVVSRYTDAGSDASLPEEIAAAAADLSALQRTASSSVGVITADRSGYFSGNVDGYESVLTVSGLSLLTVSAFDALSDRAGPVPTVNFGKLIYDKTWYYVTAVPQAYASELLGRSTVSVAFAQGMTQEIPMQITRISDAENGKCIVVLSCDNYLSQTTSMRKVSASIVFHSYSGLRVPKLAVRIADDASGVYIKEASTAKWKPITILYETDDAYIVAQDKSSTKNLWPGDEILINATDLYDGKVVY